MGTFFLFGSTLFACDANKKHPETTIYVIVLLPSFRHLPSWNQSILQSNVKFKHSTMEEVCTIKVELYGRSLILQSHFTYGMAKFNNLLTYHIMCIVIFE